MGFWKTLKNIFIFKDEKLEPKEFETLSKEEYEKMSVKELLDLRYDKRIPTEELLKVLNVLEKVYPPGVCHCRTYKA